MPIKIPDQLPASNVLREENIFVMSESRASTQEIRPLKVLILNLMPKKIETETQFLRLLSNSPLQSMSSCFVSTIDQVRTRQLSTLILSIASLKLLKTVTLMDSSSQVHHLVWFSLKM